MSKVVYFIRGVPGSGKTTLAKALKVAGVITTYFEADQYFTDVWGKYTFDGTKIGEAHKWCMEKAEYAFGTGVSFAVSNTFTKDVYLSRYRAMAKHYGYNIVEIVMKSDFKSVHNVPDSTVLKMKDQLHNTLVSDWSK